MSKTLSILCIMNHFVDNSPPNLPPEGLAGVFDRLLWCTLDNGGEIVTVCESWLKGDDFKRIAIVLAMQEVFPFQDAQEMQMILSRIAMRWPQLAARCNELIEIRSNGGRR